MAGNTVRTARRVAAWAFMGSPPPPVRAALFFCGYDLTTKLAKAI